MLRLTLMGAALDVRLVLASQSGLRSYVPSRHWASKLQTARWRKPTQERIANRGCGSEGTKWVPDALPAEVEVPWELMCLAGPCTLQDRAHHVPCQHSGPQVSPHWSAMVAMRIQPLLLQLQLQLLVA
mmetsp:Transcript_10511/g.32673  ORF Transcript_10511/g.32673 Transcript_10511/m.32673 type:complete len:128 (-) Transcript_10511:623-1006(-)